MADSNVDITAGSGTSIDTRTEATNGNHRQVVVIGDPATNAGVAPVDATAGLKVDLGADNDVTVTGTVTVDGSGVTQPVSGTVTANLGAIDNAVLDSIDTQTAGTETNTSTIAGAIVGSEMQVDVVGALPAGDNNIGNVDIASALPAGTNTVGNVGLAPQTSGGLTIFRSIDLDESEEQVKGTAGQVYGWFLSNLSASAVYVKFYNATAASVTVGTTTPVLTIPLEADQAANVEFTNGIAFGTAITVAATTGIADSDTGAPGANEVVANIFYK